MPEFPGTAAFAECCQRVIRAARLAPKGALLEYAAVYAKAGLAMQDLETIRTQALYILSNTSRWRGNEARAVRAQLKAFAA